MSSKEERKISDVKLQTQQYRLNEAAALFKVCMSNMSQILNCKSDDDDSETAEADSLLRIVREYVTTRLQPKTGRIILTEAAVPDRPRNSIEQEYLLHLKAIQRTECMKA